VQFRFFRMPRGHVLSPPAHLRWACSHFVPYMRVHKCAGASTVLPMRKAQDLPLFRAMAGEIKARRAALQISQEELAHRAEVHRSFIARLEVAETQPSLAALFRLAHGLEADVVDLVSGIKRRYAREHRDIRRS